MKFLKWAVLIVLIFILGYAFYKYYTRPKKIEKKEAMLEITSPAFAEGGGIPQKYTCDGEGLSPPLSIAKVPQDTRSLVLVVEDPDAPGLPAGRQAFTHWIVLNIAPETKEIGEDSIPTGAQVNVNDFGKNAYGGPCPPSGTHRYFFKIYALSSQLNVSSSDKLSEVKKVMEEFIIDSGKLMAKYRRVRE